MMPRGMGKDEHETRAPPSPKASRCSQQDLRRVKERAGRSVTALVLREPRPMKTAPDGRAKATKPRLNW